MNRLLALLHCLAILLTHRRVTYSSHDRRISITGYQPRWRRRRN